MQQQLSGENEGAPSVVASSGRVKIIDLEAQSDIKCKHMPPGAPSKRNLDSSHAFTNWKSKLYTETVTKRHWIAIIVVALGKTRCVLCSSIAKMKKSPASEHQTAPPKHHQGGVAFLSLTSSPKIDCNKEVRRKIESLFWDISDVQVPPFRFTFCYRCASTINEIAHRTCAEPFTIRQNVT